MTAETTLHGLQQQLSSIATPFSQDYLKTIRTVLIQKTLGPPSNLALPADAATTFFTQLLATVNDPAISQPHRALAAETVSVWLIRTRAHDSLRAPFPAALGKLGDVFLAHFDDATSLLAKALKDLLANVLALATRLGVAEEVLDSLATKGLAGVSVGEGRKGAYYALDLAVRKGVGAASVFERAGGAQKLVRRLLANLVDRDRAPSIGKLVVGLLKARRKELGDGKGEQEWMHIWEAPLRDAMRSEELRHRVVTYVLLGVMGLSAECFRIFLEGFGLDQHGNLKDMGDSDLGALLCCLKAGKELGFVGEIGDADATAPTTTKAPTIRLQPDLVTPLLGHAYAHIRLSAFNLVIQSTSITRPFTHEALALLESALPPLFVESDAETRDQIIGGLRSLIERLAQSTYSCEKELRNVQLKLRSGHRPSKDDIHNMIQLDSRIRDASNFCESYINFLETLLWPGANYQRCIMGLRAMSFLIRSGVDASLAESTFSALPGNGSIASDGEPFKKGVFKWPAFSQKFRVFTPGIKTLLLEVMSNAFEDVRIMSSELLRFDIRWDKSILIPFLERGMKAMNESGRLRDSDGVARTVSLIFDLVKRGDIFFEEGEMIRGSPIGQGHIGIVTWLLGVIEKDYLAMASEDLSRAVRERPVHGLFESLGMVLRGVYRTNLSEESVQLQKEVHERVFRTCEEIWRLTKAPLCFQSPEGYVPSEMDEEDEDMNTQTLMSYSWRAVKESSELLGLMLGEAPLPTLNSMDFERGGNLLLQQLGDIRHRGAFSAVAPSFAALCTRCFKSTDSALEELPKTWLANNLDSIMEKSSVITRRSAGLPSLIVGVLASEPNPDRPLLSSTFARLLEIATLPAAVSKDGDKVDLPQVHALNCIKFLFTDARVSQVVVPYIGVGLEVAVSCFGSEVWAIRNCGVMLFTSLTNRLFGLRKSRNDYHSNFTTRSFFEKYAAVRSVLLNNLQEKVGGLERGEASSVEMVYPALSLIARMEVDPEYEGMEEFRGLVLECMRSRIWKVREMAARAYTALVGPGQVLNVIAELMAVGTEKQNVLHGNLCAVRALLERRVGQAVLEEVEPGSVWKSIGGVFQETFDCLVVRNRSAVTKAVMMHILTAHAVDILGDADHAGLAECIGSYILRCDVSEECNQSSVIGRSFLKEHLVSFHLTYTRLLQHAPDQFSEALNGLLLCADEEINLYTVNFILALEKLPEMTTVSKETMRQQLWNMVANHQWDLVVARALTLLHRWYTEYDDCVDGLTDMTDAVASLMAMVRTPRTEPIKEASLSLLGPLIAKIPAEKREEPLRTLLAELSKFSQEEPFTTRLAALTCLASLAPLLKLSGEPDESLISSYVLLFDFLNDDDDEIRLAASRIAKTVLPGEQILLLPQVAARNLTLALRRAFPTSQILLREAMERVTGVRGDISAAAARTAWEQATKRDTILFRREKQNLWVDTKEVVQVWGLVAQLLVARGGSVEGLKDWLEAAKECVGSMEGRDEPGGLKSEEEVAVFVERVEIVGRICG